MERTLIELEKLLTAEAMKGTPYEAEYLSTAPRPEDWSKHLSKVTTFNQKDKFINGDDS